MTKQRPTIAQLLADSFEEVEPHDCHPMRAFSGVGVCEICGRPWEEKSVLPKKIRA